MFFNDLGDNVLRLDQLQESIVVTMIDGVGPSDDFEDLSVLQNLNELLVEGLVLE